jgi:hypothetical protein
MALSTAALASQQQALPLHISHKLQGVSACGNVLRVF